MASNAYQWDDKDQVEDTESPTPSPIPTLTPYEPPDPTEAPTPVPSSSIPENGETPEPSALTESKRLVDTNVEYDGPPKTGKTLKDLAMELGAPDSIGTLLDDMQEALIGIVGDLTNNTGERTSLADILSHENRLRGLGALFVLVAVVGIILDSTVGDSILNKVAP